ncbi:ectoine hydrolase DoeA [Coralliovum pocilloporae]|uniref:ectoine hydrolase DoeA n=1 Tax=Coralliovum pocilloporae TaxID=3066369 RepID=UPI003307A242
MPDVALPFARTEYASRLSRTRSAMAEAGIDVLFVADPSNMAWLTGYDGWSFYVHQGVLIGPDGEPVLWCRSQDANGGLRTCYMDADNIIGYPDHYVMATDCHPMEHLAGLIRERGWSSLRLGVEMENYYYSARAHAVLSRELGPSIADATALVNWQRACKSDAELSYMRRAARIVEDMHRSVAETIRPGLRKNELVAEIYRTALIGSEDEAGAFGGDYPAIVPLLPTGSDAAAPHLTWDDKVLETGAGTFFELSGCYRRYHAPLCRTIYLGTPPDHMLRAEEAVLEGLDAGIQAARAGNTTGDVARAFQAVLERFGIKRDARCGYPIGLSYPPDWGERTYSIRASDTTELRPGMTFHFMPGLWMDDWGMEITETLLIRDEGPAECLANVPRAMVVKS